MEDYCQNRDTLTTPAFFYIIELSASNREKHRACNQLQDTQFHYSPQRKNHRYVDITLSS